jgi:hypothetical protein
MQKMRKKVFIPAFGAFLALMTGVMLIHFPWHPLPIQQAEKPARHDSKPDPKARFKKVLPFSQIKPLGTAAWSVGTVKGAPAWRDNKTGLVWAPKLDGLSFVTLLEGDLAQAMNACAVQKPAGAWLLPLAQELDEAKADGLIQADPDAQHHWITYMHASGMLVPASRAWDAAVNQEIFFVRCVGRDKK